MPVLPSQQKNKATVSVRRKKNSMHADFAQKTFVCMLSMPQLLLVHAQSALKSHNFFYNFLIINQS
jgi:hypothetical protein